MRILSPTEVGQELAKRMNKPVLLLSNLFPDPEYDDGFLFTTADGDQKLLAAPFIDFDLAMGDSALILCDHEEEMMDLYDLTYGDDGLNRQAREKHNYPMYEGEHKVYALTINRDGTLGTENT